jgi:hypothetical protein
MEGLMSLDYATRLLMAAIHANNTPSVGESHCRHYPEYVECREGADDILGTDAGREIRRLLNGQPTDEDQERAYVTRLVNVGVEALHEWKKRRS